VELAGIEVENIHDFMGALAGLKVGEKTNLTVLRDGQRIELEVVPGSRE
jgi:S1-C subfamily serine protease